MRLLLSRKSGGRLPAQEQGRGRGRGRGSKEACAGMFSRPPPTHPSPPTTPDASQLPCPCLRPRPPSPRTQVSFDHPDPSIFTVLTCPSAIPGGCGRLAETFSSKASSCAGTLFRKRPAALHTQLCWARRKGRRAPAGPHRARSSLQRLSARASMRSGAQILSIASHGVHGSSAPPLRLQFVWNLRALAGPPRRRAPALCAGTPKASVCHGPWASYLPGRAILYVLSHAGTAVADFVIFPPRWTVAEHTFKPPYFHRCAGAPGDARGVWGVVAQGVKQGSASYMSLGRARHVPMRPRAGCSQLS